MFNTLPTYMPGPIAPLIKTPAQTTATSGQWPEPARQSLDFFPYFQPIIEVASGRISSYEALARSRNNRGVILSAGALFSDPQISDLNKRRLDQQLRRQALAQAHALPANTRMTLNISPQWIDTLEEGGVIPTLEMIAQAGVDPRRIVIELTELSGDIKRILAVVQRYRQAGLQIAIDDFGAGFSQLDRVIALEPDIIKLDMQLFKQAFKGGIAEQVVESLVELSTKTGARIVCEGVETAEEFHFGLKCGAGYMQGYLFAPAGPDFLSTDAYEAQVDRLRQDFFAQMSRQERHKIEQVRRIKQDVLALLALLQQQSPIDPDSLQRLYCGPPNLLRFYICDRNGKQVTANYNFDHPQQRWRCDPSQIGYNWAWRPYFYQLAALDSLRCDRLVASNRYQDLASGQLCKTFAMLLDEQQVLLVDIIADWM